MQFTIRPSDLRLRIYKWAIDVDFQFSTASKPPTWCYAILSTPTADDPTLAARFGSAACYDVHLRHERTT
jgi:hypothetical protein